MDKLRNAVTKLPLLLLIGMMANIIIAGSAFGAVYWTDTSNTPIDAGTLNMSAGETRVVRLCADLESGQTLKAFTFNLTYDTSLEIVNIKKTNDFVVVYINKDHDGAGTIRITGFDTKGQEGAAVVSFIDVTITKAAAGTGGLNVAEIEQFGEDASTQFVPTEIKPLTVNITDIVVGANEVYWTDTNGVRLDAMNLVPGQQMTVRLKAEIATGNKLAAFKFTLPYDSGISIVSVKQSEDTAIPHNPDAVDFPSVNYNNDTAAGQITANGFTTDAIDGPAIVSFIDVTVEAMSEATSNLRIEVNNFGETENDTNLPTALDITFNVASVTASQAYWADTNNIKLPSITVLQGGSKVVRLVATVPEGKTLGAYKFTLTYNSSLVSVSAVETPNAPFPPNNINTATSGEIVINGFDSIGFKGSDFLAFIDVTMTWKSAGSFPLEIKADNYGASAADEFLPTTTPLTVTVEEPPTPPVSFYNVNFTAGTNGSISGAANQTVAAGGNASAVTAVPAAGYMFINWTGSITSTNNPLTVSDVYSNMSITANFAPDTNFTVKFIAGENGSITGDLEQSVATGGSTTSVKAEPNAGYVFVNWTGKNSYVSKTNPLIITNVSENLEITANFTEDVDRTVNFIAGENGSVEGNKTQVVAAGNSTEIVEAVASQGFQFLNWIGTDGFVSTDNPLIVASVVKDMDITANFAEAGVNIYTVNFVAGKNGNVSGGAIQTIVEGKSTSEVTAVPSQGYKFVNWTGTDGFSSSDKHLIITNVMKHMTIKANFTKGTTPIYTVTFSADSNGTISVGATTQRVEEGDSTSEVTANPDPGYKFDNWTGTGGYASEANPLKIPNIKSNMDIIAHFSMEVDPNAPNAPALVMPDDGAVDVLFKPELQTGSYSSPIDQPHGWTIWEIATESGFAESNLVLKIKTKANSALDFSSLKVQDFILTEKGKKYYWRAKHVDTLDVASAWSSIWSFTTATVNDEFLEDSRVPLGQEVSDNELNSLFTESDQDGALFVRTVIGNSIIGIKGLENVDEVQWLKSLGLTDLPVSELGSNLTFPKGLVTYKIKTNKIGELVKVKLMINTVIPSNAVWYAYNQNVVEGWEIVKVETASNRKYITYEIQDGGFGDADGARNGLILDPIGYAVPTTPEPEPCDDCDGGGGSDTCFISAASYGNSGLILMVMTFISAVSVFFGRKK